MRVYAVAYTSCRVRNEWRERSIEPRPIPFDEFQVGFHFQPRVDNTSRFHSFHLLISYHYPVMYRPSSPSPANLTSLPPELLLRIYQYFLSPLSISRLAQTCHLLNHIANSELIWKDIVLDLVNTFGVEVEEADSTFVHRNSPPSTSFNHDSREESTWRDQAKFLLPNARHLGYFASSIPFRLVLKTISLNFFHSGTSLPQL